MAVDLQIQLEQMSEAKNELARKEIENQQVISILNQKNVETERQNAEFQAQIKNLKKERDDKIKLSTSIKIKSNS